MFVIELVYAARAPEVGSPVENTVKKRRRMKLRGLRAAGLGGVGIEAFAVLAMLGALACAPAHGQTYDVVISHGIVMDPESGLDAVRNVGISNGRIRTISTASLTGKRDIDARGLVVAPGFIWT